MYHVLLCITTYSLSHNIMYCYELLGIIIQNNARKINNTNHNK